MTTYLPNEYTDAKEVAHEAHVRTGQIFDDFSIESSRLADKAIIKMELEPENWAHWFSSLPRLPLAYRKEMAETNEDGFWYRPTDFIDTVLPCLTAFFKDHDEFLPGFKEDTHASSCFMIAMYARMVNINALDLHRKGHIG